MVELFVHQKIALAYMKTNDAFALFMEQGCGKTLVALMHLLYLLKEGKIKTFLIVAPKSALGAWERDIEMFDDDDRKLLSDAMTLINYDKVWRGKKASPYFHNWGAVILDEAHNIKNRTSRRSSFLLKLSLHCEYRYILTGTPIGNGHLENIWSEFTFLAPIQDKRSVSCEWLGKYSDFEKEYCDLNQYWQPYRYRNVKKLQDIINAHSYRVTKDECLDLPEKLPDEIWSIELEEKKRYRELAKDSAIVELDVLAENPLTRMLKLRQFCSGQIVGDMGTVTEVKHGKLTLLGEFVEDYDKKLVIFAQFKKSIKDIEGLLKKKKIKFVTLDGDQKDKNIWRKFQSDETIRVIVVQYESGSSGIDLFASSTMIFYEPTIRSNTLEQARDRIHRTGQHHPCQYIHFITKGTVEEQIYKALSNFSDFSEKLFTEYITNYVRTYSK